VVDGLWKYPITTISFCLFYVIFFLGLNFVPFYSILYSWVFRIKQMYLYIKNSISTIQASNKIKFILCSFNTRLKTKKWYQPFDHHCNLIVPSLCPKCELKSDGTPRKIPSSVRNSPNCLLYRHAIEVILPKLA